jgi:phosphate transport system protein
MATIARWRANPRALHPSNDARVDVASLDRQVLQLFAMVGERVAAATDAFLDGDREAARDLMASEPAVDSLHLDVEALVVEELGRRRTLDDEELRLLVLLLRIVPELERSGDLVEHVAMRTGQGLDRSISPAARGLIASMGRVAAGMWEAAAEAYARRDRSAAEVLRLADDELDDLHVRLSDELGRAALPPSAAIELGLVARFLERLGDHAVNVTRRLGPAPVPEAG